MGHDALYKEIILEHHKDPRNHGLLESATASITKHNPLCGDNVTVQIKLSPDNKTVDDIMFSGSGCSISVASASILTDDVKGQSVEKTLKLIEQFRGVMQGNEKPEVLEGDVEALTGVRQFPVRIKCALLAWTALKELIENQNKEKSA
ncbi:MAG: SUF system NifU family Fe-S cluster assembly protein [Xanthomonadaceae bacterium]|nr:SUF system NifU family Fe-S cluster assembly protein [Xanthomonadaceae bacterium]